MTVKTEDDVADAVKAATGPLRINGSSTRPYGRPVDGVELSVGGVSGITLYEPAALTLVAKAGTSVAEIDATLAQESQRLAFEPMDHRALLGTTGTPTIGGAVAGNVSGPRRVAVGALRDFLLGVRYVDGHGDVIKNGGRVMKNVTGYDLVKLMAGSHGTLGVLTEVSLKVMPDVEAMATLRFKGLDIAQAVALMSAALGSPFDVNGAAYQTGDTLIRIEGFDQSVTYRTEQLKNHLAQFGAAEVEREPDKVRALWTSVRDVQPFATHSHVWRISLRPSDTADFLDAFEDEMDVQLDWGGGLVWLATTDIDHEAAIMRHHQLQAAATGKGHATLIKGPQALRQSVPSFQPEPAPLAAISKGLRERFDPRGIFNPGIMT